MFCPVCGSSIENGDVFCSYCGSMVAAKNGAQNKEPEIIKEPEVNNIPEVNNTYDVESTPFEAQPTYETPIFESTFRPVSPSDAEYKKMRDIAMSAMILGIVSCGTPLFLALIFSLISKKKLKKLKGYKAPGINGFVTAAKATSTVGFIYGLICTVILGLVYILPTLIWIIYIVVMIVCAIIYSIGGGMSLI